MATSRRYNAQPFLVHDWATRARNGMHSYGLSAGASTHANPTRPTSVSVSGGPRDSYTQSHYYVVDNADVAITVVWTSVRHFALIRSCY